MNSWQSGYSRGVLTSEPTKWNKKLVELYSRQSQQLQEHHANLRQRDQELVKRSEKESIPALLQDLASFSTSIRALKDKLDSKKEENQKEDKDEVKAVFAKYNLTSNSQDFSDKYKANKKELKKDSIAYKRTIKQLLDEEKISPETAQDMLRFNPYQQIVTAELMGDHLLKNTYGEQALLKHLTNDGIPGSLAAYHNSPDKVNQQLEFGLQQVEHLNFSNEFIANQLIDPLAKRAATRKNVSKNQGLARVSEFETTQWYQSIEGPNPNEAILHKIEELRDNKYKPLLVDGFVEGTKLTATQAAVQEVFQNLQGVLIDGDARFNIHSLDKFLGDKLEGHAAGGTNSVFFSDEQINSLVASSMIGIGKSEARLQATLTNELSVLNDQANRADISQDQYDAAILALENRGFADTKALAAAKKKKISSETQGGYELSKTTLTKYIDTGFYGVTKDDIEAIPNSAVRTQAMKLWERIEKYRNRTNNGSSSVGSMLQTIQSTRSQLPWAEGGDPQVKAISNEIDKDTAVLEFDLIMSQYDDDGNYTANYDILGAVNKAKSDLFEARGGGKVATATDSGGRYSVTSNENGSFDNFERLTGLRLVGAQVNNIKLTQATANHWSQEIANNFTNKTKDEILKMGVFNIHDLAGYMATGNPSDKMLFYEDVLNIDLPSLILSSIDNIAKHPDQGIDRDSKLLGLESWKMLPENKVELEKMQQAQNQLSNDLDVLYRSRGPTSKRESLDILDMQRLLRKGWYRLSPNQKFRIYRTLSENVNLDTDLENYEGRVDTIQEKIGRDDETVKGESLGIIDQWKHDTTRDINIKKNESTITADSFSAKPERSDEEIEEQFNAQPGVF